MLASAAADEPAAPPDEEPAPAPEETAPPADESGDAAPSPDEISSASSAADSEPAETEVSSTSPAGVTSEGSSAAPSTTETAVPAPELVVAPGTVDFEAVTIGSAPTRTIELRNVGTAALTVTSVTIADDPEGGFEIVSGFPATIAPGATVTVTVAMSPSKVGAHTARLVVATDDPRGSFGVDLVGRGTTWQLDGTIAARGPPAADEVVDHTVRVAEGSIEFISADGTVDAISLDGITGVSIQGGSGNDTLRIDSSGGLAISFSGGDGNDTLSLVGEAADTTWTVTGAGTGSATGGLSFTGVENLAGAANNEDTFVVETGGSVASVDGGDGGFDSLIVSGATSTLVLGAVDPNSGSVSLGGQTIAYFGLEPVTTSVTAADVVIDLPNTSNTATLEVDPGDATKLRISGSGFETTSFTIPTATITLNLGGGDDALTIGGLGTFAGSLAVDGGSGIDLLGTTRISVALPATTYTDVERLSVGFVREVRRGRDDLRCSDCPDARVPGVEQRRRFADHARPRDPRSCRCRERLDARGSSTTT